MASTAPTLRLAHTSRALGDVKAADARRLALDVTSRPGRFVRRVSDVWLEQPIDDRWMAAYRIVTGDGRPRVAELRVFPREDGFVSRPPGEWSGGFKGVEAQAPRQGLKKAIINRVRLQEWTTQVRAIRAAWEQQVGPERARVMKGVLARFGPLPASPPPRTGTPGRGRPALPDEFYATVAAEYVAALEAGRPPVKAIAQRHATSEARVRGWVHRARAKGLLEGRGQGQALGTLSDRAIFLSEAVKQRRRARREKGGQRSATKADRRRAQTRRRP